MIALPKFGKRNDSPLKSRGIVFGLGWSATTQIVSTLVEIGSTLILTRLLAPETFAILGTAMVVLTTLEWLSDVGVTPALIRSPEGDQRDWLLVGWLINLGRGLVLSSMAALVSIPFATLSQQPAMQNVMLVLALRPLIMAFRSPGMPLLRRHLEYKALFFDEILQTFVGSLVSILVAVAFQEHFHTGAWALVAGTLAGGLTAVVISYVLSPIAPRLYWDWKIAHVLASFGVQLFLNTLAMALWLNLDRLVGPRFVSLQALGWYTIAWNLANAGEMVLSRGAEVYFSLLSRRPSHEQRDWHHAATTRLYCWLGPLLAVAVVVSPSVVRILYDSRYEGAGMLLAILLARLMFRSLGHWDSQLLIVQGYVRPASIASLAAAGFLGLAIVPLCMEFGAVGLAVASTISAVVAIVTQSLLSRQLGTRALVRTAWVALGAIVGLIICAVVES